MAKNAVRNFITLVDEVALLSRLAVATVPTYSAPSSAVTVILYAAPSAAAVVVSSAPLFL